MKKLYVEGTMFLGGGDPKGPQFLGGMSSRDNTGQQMSRLLWELNKAESSRGGAVAPVLYN